MKTFWEDQPRKKALIIQTWTAVAVIAVATCPNQAQEVAEKFGPENPFFAPSTLPFQAPPFNEIKDTDYQPAIEAGIAQQVEEVKAIAENPEPPTFENTFVALERSGALLQRVSSAFNCVSSANTNPELQRVQQDEAPRLAANQDAIHLNGRLFARIRTIYNRRESLHLDQESSRLVEWEYKEFVKAGAELSMEDKARLKKIDEEDSTLQAIFMAKLMAASKAAAYTTTDAVALSGLSPSEMSDAAEDARARGEKGWVLPLQNTTVQPDSAFLNDRATRKALFEDSWNRAERGDANDTRSIIVRLAKLRAQKAALLRFPNYAAWELSDQMAQNPQNAIEFIDQLVPGATAKAAREAAEIQSVIDAQNSGFKLEPWDWDFYSEQVRKAKYAFDEKQIKPYFELHNVLKNGVFYAAHELYGISFKERSDIPVYQPDVRVFEVYDSDRKPLALFYCDYFKRDNKQGGAWTDSFVKESKLLGTLPVVYNAANFTKPAVGQPALISFDDVTGMFHEFGHALNAIFANTVYPSLSGPQTPSDFLEFPSQFNEQWERYPRVFRHYARDYKTGVPIPAKLAGELLKSRTFNQGYMLTEMLEASELDLQWHMVKESAAPEDPDAFESEVLHRAHLDISSVPPRYRSSYFLHIWAEGYAAGYYAYLWAEMLDDNAYQWFLDHGG